MAEVYTKPFESVQAAIALFEQKIDPKKCSTSSNKEGEGEFLEDLSDCSLLQEAMDHETDLAFFKFDASSESTEELLTLLNLYRAERDNYKEKFRRLNEMEEMENELVKQMIISEYLLMELKQSKEAQSIFSKSVLSAMNELDFLKSENEQMKLVDSEREDYILEIKEEGRIMKEMLIISSAKMKGMNFQIEMLVADIQRMQKEFQPNVTNLTSELHSFSGEISAINEPEASSGSAQAGLNQAIQKLGVEAEEAKTEEQKPNEYDETKTENEENGSNKNSGFIDADTNGFCTGVSISMEEYEVLFRKFELTNWMSDEPTERSEVNKLKKELEDKKAEIIELRTILEGTVKRAALAEKAELAMETKLRKWRLRRAASEAVKEYCATKNENERQNERPFLSKLACINPEPHGVHSHPKRSVSMPDGRKSKRVPLGKLLKIKI